MSRSTARWFPPRAVFRPAFFSFHYPLTLADCKRRTTPPTFVDINTRWSICIESLFFSSRHHRCAERKGWRRRRGPLSKLLTRGWDSHVGRTFAISLCHVLMQGNRYRSLLPWFVSRFCPVYSLKMAAEFMELLLEIRDDQWLFHWMTLKKKDK